MDSKNNKKPITEAQKKARLINLQKGREVRKQKQESKGKEYDLSSESSQSDSESDNEAFVISRKKKVVPKEVVERSRKSVHMEQPQNTNNYQKDFDELRNMVQDLAALQKKTKLNHQKDLMVALKLLFYLKIIHMLLKIIHNLVKMMMVLWIF